MPKAFLAMFLSTSRAGPFIHFEALDYGNWINSMEKKLEFEACIDSSDL